MQGASLVWAGEQLPVSRMRPTGCFLRRVVGRPEARGHNPWEEKEGGRARDR